MGIPTLFFLPLFFSSSPEEEGGQAERCLDLREGVEAKQGCEGLGGG